jgi:hypothetical protein
MNSSNDNPPHNLNKAENRASRNVRIPFVKVDLEIARALGVKEAMILSFIEFWISWKTRRYPLPKDGIPKVYLRYKDFTESLPYSERSIRGINYF